MKRKYESILIISISVISFVVWGITIHSQTKVEPPISQIQTNPDQPTLDYETEIRQTFSNERKARNRRFNGRGGISRNRPIVELPVGDFPLPITGYWWRDLPALPVAQSSTIIMGDIINGEAHLSDDRSGIYTEYTVQVTNIFKDITNLAKVNTPLLAQRIGGGVRFNSSKIQNYTINRQGIPQKGQRYILFLKTGDDGDNSILTGYKIDNNLIVPLDGEDNQDPRANLPFARYRGVPLESFLRELNATLQSQSNNGGA